MKKPLALALCTLLVLSLLSACGKSDTAAPSSAPPQSAQAEPAAPLRLAALKGPTAMGLVQLMQENEAGGSLAGDYTVSLAGSPDEIGPKLIQGELDVACVPANLAAVLYQKTQGAVVTLGVNTLGVLYLVENGETVSSMADLKGKTIVASGKGASPEYALRYLLQENGLNADTDVTIEWKSEHAECVAALASGAATVALLPQPFATAALGKLPEGRVALDLNQAWDALDNGSSLVTGVVVARREVVEQDPQAIENFLERYAASVAWVNGNVADAAALIGSYGIVDAAVAEQALPACHIVLLTGREMKTALSGYLEVLYAQDAAAVGGALPQEDFYYGGQ